MQTPEPAPARNDEQAAAHFNAGNALQRQGRLAEAVDSYRRALALKPGYAAAYNNMGVALVALGEPEAAVASYLQALGLDPAYASAHNNLGNALQSLGEFDRAAEHYRKALLARPDYAEAHNNLGNALLAQGEPDAAVASYQRALGLNPNYAEAHYNLGNARQAAGQAEAAIAHYQQALELAPGYADARNNLALLFNAQGHVQLALNTIAQSLQNPQDDTARRIFAACASQLSCREDDPELRALVLRALSERWGRPGDLARLGTDLVKAGKHLGPGIARAVAAWPARLAARELFGENGPDASDALLNALLCATSVTDLALERFLTTARHALLQAAADTASDAALDFYGALARQCFINEYVFCYSADEICAATELREALIAALDAQQQPPALPLLAVAAYFPLHALPHAKRLLAMPWPQAVAAVLTQQVREPEEEQRLRATIPSLTGIEDEVSRLVQRQYEQNPYPRWVQAGPAAKAEPAAAYLRHRFPLADFRPRPPSGRTDVLIAGCGTGQQSLDAARKFQGAQVLAVDLSLSSLAYAKRKTQELGVDNIEYAQADLLKLGAPGRSFDLIESVGVLHHLAQPYAGWRVLLSLLRPGGFMRLGFYSEIARRHIVQAQAFVAAQGYGATASEIRRCRQDLLNSDRRADFGGALTTADFFSISSCRDLLFHVQEHRMTLTGIDEFIRNNRLAFLGMEIESGVTGAYQRRFPGDPAAINLAQWQIFEQENPDTFFGMYQFWVQKVA